MRSGRTPAARRIWLTSAAMCLTLVAAGCASGTDAAQHPGGGLDASHPLGGDPATEGTPVAGGTLRVGMLAEPRSFDPTVGVNSAASAVYDSLLKFDKNGAPQPYLAKSMKTTDDGTTWQLGLRPGVTFQDGTPLNADAVIFNIQRAQQKPTARDHVYTEPIKSMTATDDLTVTFTLKQPYGSFPDSFALSFTSGNLGSIASPTAIKKWGKDYGRHPVGAGPFSFVEWKPDSQIVVTKFADYWQKGLPRLDKIVFRPLSDTESRYASVVNGDVDLTYAGYHSELFRSSKDTNLNTYFGPGGGATFLYFNFTKPPFNDKRMREAVIRAIDPKALSATQYNNAMDVAQTAFAPDSPYYSAEAAKAYPAYDPAKAKALIAAYQADGGKTDFTFSESNSPNVVLLSQFLQAQWAAVGLHVKLAFYDLAKWTTSVVQGGDFQIGGWSSGPWSSAFPNMHNIFATGDISNYGGYSNPQMDKVLDEAVSTTDPATAIADYKQAQVIANKDLAVGWLARAYKGNIGQKKVRGVVRDLSGEVYYATTWLAG